MLEGLAQSYLEALSQTIRPADDFYWPGRDSPRRRRALRSSSDMRGEIHDSSPDTPDSGACNQP